MVNRLIPRTVKSKKSKSQFNAERLDFLLLFYFELFTFKL